MCRQARFDVSRFKWILTICCSWVWQSVNHICNTKSQQLTYFNHGLGGEQHQHHCWVLGAVTLVKLSIVFMLITLIICLSAVMCAFRNERARWITALGQNVNNKKCQDRASKFPPTHRHTHTRHLQSGLLRHRVVVCGNSFSQILISKQFSCSRQFQWCRQHSVILE